MTKINFSKNYIFSYAGIMQPHPEKATTVCGYIGVSGLYTQSCIALAKYV